MNMLKEFVIVIFIKACNFKNDHIMYHFSETNISKCKINNSKTQVSFNFLNIILFEILLDELCILHCI